AELADARSEPDRGVAPRPAELEHLAVGLRRDEREEEAAGSRLDLARPELGREAALPLVGVLALEALEHGADAIVEHWAGNYRCKRARRADHRDRADAGGRLLLPHRRLPPSRLAVGRQERDAARRADPGVPLAVRQGDRYDARDRRAGRAATVQ